MPAPADPSRLFEAVHWFRRQVPVTPAQYARLEARARQFAFRIASTTQQDLVADVYRQLLKAIKNGTSLEDFKAKVQAKLERDWQGDVANPAARVETIFRTNTQKAFNAGRWAQMNDPEVLERRPIWMLVTIQDSRTSRICRAFAGVILPATSSFWATHWPPLHFNCRSTVRPLTPKMAERYGGPRSQPPRRLPQEGFGRVDESYSLPPRATPLPRDLAKAFRRPR